MGAVHVDAIHGVVAVAAADLAVAAADLAVILASRRSRRQMIQPPQAAEGIPEGVTVGEIDEQKAFGSPKAGSGSCAVGRASPGTFRVAGGGGQAAGAAGRRDRLPPAPSGPAARDAIRPIIESGLVPEAIAQVGELCLGETRPPDR